MKLLTLKSSIPIFLLFSIFSCPVFAADKTLEEEPRSDSHAVSQQAKSTFPAATVLCDEAMDDDYLETVRGGTELFASLSDVMVQKQREIILWDEVEENNNSRNNSSRNNISVIGPLTEQSISGNLTQRR
jgi:hypothetical protein